MAIFLIAYDYGMGGLWGLMDAPSEAAIYDKYPEIKVVHERPKWMTDSQFEKMKEKEQYRLEDLPWGMLKAALSDRAEKAKHSAEPPTRER